jgi:hypothetical protein
MWGCQSNPGAKAEPSVEAPAKVPAAAVADGALALTEAKVLAFISYQDAVVALAGWDAGTKDRTAVIVERAQRDERARVVSGLTARELDDLEELVASLAQKRWLARWAGGEEVTDKIEAWAEEATDEHKKVVAGTLEALKAKAQAREDLTAQRTRFGEANVTLVLKHEAKLFELWQAMMKR